VSVSDSDLWREKVNSEQQFSEWSHESGSCLLWQVKFRKVVGDYFSRVVQMI
jgi:hypothetical protein